jgi:hypothetical protein
MIGMIGLEADLRYSHFVQWKAPAASSGAMANMLFFEDRSIVSSVVNTLSSGAGGQFNGILYFPNFPVSYSSGSSSNWGYTTLVAKTLSFTSGSYFHSSRWRWAGWAPGRRRWWNDVQSHARLVRGLCAPLSRV